MGLRVFETNTAKYYLGLGRHDQSSASIFKDVDFSKINILVLEDYFSYSMEKQPDGNSVVRTYAVDLESIIQRYQYKELVDRVVAENEEIAIYGVDSPPDYFFAAVEPFTQGPVVAAGSLIALFSASDAIKKREKLSRREFLKYGTKFVFGCMLTTDASAALINASTEKNMVPVFTELHNFKTNVFPSPVVGFRDALVAKKITDYLVPLHKKPEEKLSIAIVYGAGHSGLETKLKHPSIANATMYFYQDILNYGLKDQFNEVRKLVITPFGFMTTYLDCGLF